MDTWRLLDTGILPAAENIALDEALLQSRSEGESSSTLRLLRYAPPAVLVGYHQSVEQEVRGTYCREHGIQINRRITGGGAILFDETQIGWELIALKEDFGVGGVVLPLFRRICEGTIAGLRKLGVHAQFRPKNDIEVQGRKISGTGGTEEGGAFLFQGTLLMDFDIETMLRALRIPLEKLKDKEIETAKERVTCLKWEIGALPAYETVKSALREGFEETFGMRLLPGPLNDYEQRLFAEKTKRMRSDAWIYQRKSRADEQQNLRSVHKAKGGLIRTALIYHVRQRRIKSILITGDFFAFPKRTIPDLEAALKEVPASKAGEVVRTFFAERRPDIPDVRADDFVVAIREALDKATYLHYGVSLPEVNDVFTVNGTLSEIMQKPISLFLLPYCAKLVGCPYRRKKECLECGQCTVGEAYSEGREQGFHTETIADFEDLKATLTAAKRSGVEAFIGSCCEAFYAKHKRDFEEIGLPGVLIGVDSSTCYDLGKEQEAYVGGFEGQTELKIELIKRLLRNVKRKA